MRHLLFDIHERSTGRTFRLWSDGEIEGFADDAIVMNRASTLIDAFRGALFQVRAMCSEAAELLDRLQATLCDPKVSGVGSEPFGGMLPRLAPAPVKDRG